MEKEHIRHSNPFITNVWRVANQSRTEVECGNSDPDPEHLTKDLRPKGEKIQGDPVARE